MLYCFEFRAPGFGFKICIRPGKQDLFGSCNLVPDTCFVIRGLTLAVSGTDHISGSLRFLVDVVFCSNFVLQASNLKFGFTQTDRIYLVLVIWVLLLCPPL